MVCLPYLPLCFLPPVGDETIKHLVSRGAHRRFGYESLLVMFAWYFLGAAVAAGSAISSGLFVPMLMMGSITGRLVGLATTDIADKYGQLLSRKCLLTVHMSTDCISQDIAVAAGVTLKGL